jgi:glycosyltransferase involved in cell wall biosynthesis
MKAFAILDEMKLLLVTESYWPNADGGALFERRLALGLVADGLHVSVMAPSTGWERYIERDGNYNIYRERAATFWFNTKYKTTLWPFWQVRRVIRRERPDVIHIHNAYWLGLGALFWGRLYRIPVVATNHFMPENALLNVRVFNFLYRPLVWIIWAGIVWLHNRCDFVTSPTPTAVQLLRTHGLKAPARAISNGIDMGVFHTGIDPKTVIAKLGLATEQPIVLYVGRVDGEKRLDIIISALPLILKQQKVQLVIAGFGKAMAALKAQTAELGLQNEVIFTGYLDEANKPALYNAATVFVISSPAELQSIVTLEAMASGLPIVSVDVAALKELCHDGDNGYLFPENDCTALAARTNEILASDKLKKAFGEESTNIVQRSHSTEVTFDHYEAVYRQVLKHETA